MLLPASSPPPPPVLAQATKFVDVYAPIPPEPMVELKRTASLAAAYMSKRLKEEGMTKAEK